MRRSAAAAVAAAVAVVAVETESAVAWPRRHGAALGTAAAVAAVLQGLCALTAMAIAMD